MPQEPEFNGYYYYTLTRMYLAGKMGLQVDLRYGRAAATGAGVADTTRMGIAGVIR